MSILINEAYANRKTQLWRSSGTTTPAPVYKAFLGTNLNIGEGTSFHIGGLTPGQRYTFSINAGLQCAQSGGIPLMATINDGTNSVALQVSASSSTTSANLPIEVNTGASGGGSFLTTQFPGALVFSPMWSYNYAGTLNNYASMSIVLQVDLTPKTSDLYFFLLNTCSTPSVADGNKTILTAVICYTQPIV